MQYILCWLQYLEFKHNFLVILIFYHFIFSHLKNLFFIQSWELKSTFELWISTLKKHWGPCNNLGIAWELNSIKRARALKVLTPNIFQGIKVKFLLCNRNGITCAIEEYVILQRTARLIYLKVKEIERTCLNLR